MRTHETYMRRCLELGRMALEAGETPVGALVLRGDTILGEGQEESRSLLDPSAHAEVQAIRAACRALGSTDLSGCTLYTTVEPCVLCAYVIRQTGVSRVVYGIPAGQAGGVNSRYALLTDSELAMWPAPPEIVAEVLAEECRELLQQPKPNPVPEPGTPAFQREAHRQSAAVAASQLEREDQAFIDAVSDWD